MTNARDQLDLDDGAATGRGPRYLLFAGTAQPPRGGLGDLVATFTSEQEARNAFRQLRLQPPSCRSWAQLAVVDADGALRPLAWFGIGASLGGSSVKPDVPAVSRSQARPRVSRRTTMLLTAMVAVASSMVAVLVDDRGSGRSTPPNAPAVSVAPAPVPFEPPTVAVAGDSSPDR